MRFAAAQQIADAVLYEGYVLYPYRASSAKNQYRWQFGVLAPRSPGDDREPWFSVTECLLEPAVAFHAEMQFHALELGFGRVE